MKPENKETQQLNQALEELLLRNATEHYLDDSMDYEALLRETLSTGRHEFSQRHEREMRSLISTVGRKGSFFHAQRHRLASAAAVLLLLFGVGGGVIATANWEELYAFFSRRQSTHTEITLPQSVEEEYWEILKESGWESAYFPTYLPEGFVLDEVDVTDNFCLMTFRKENESISIHQSLLKNGRFFHIDTERRKASPIEINGYQGEFTEKGEQRSVYYKTESHYLVVQSDGVSKEKLVKVIKKLKIVETTK